jgi:hypothetical protein
MKNNEAVRRLAGRASSQHAPDGCLPVTLTPEQRRLVRTYALELAGHAPALEV